MTSLNYSKYDYDVGINLISDFEGLRSNLLQGNLTNRICETDINECLNANGGCDHICVNTADSFRCECRPGYALQPDGFTCIDINECSLSPPVCSQICTNTEGSYICSCSEGYILSADGSTCIGKQYK